MQAYKMVKDGKERGNYEQRENTWREKMGEQGIREV